MNANSICKGVDYSRRKEFSERGLGSSPMNLQSKITLEGDESSGPGEFHPQALTDPDVNVSAHPALIIPSLFLATLPYLLVPPITVDQKVRPDDPTPSLHPHYRDFNTQRNGEKFTGAKTPRGSGKVWR
jgi:hypothetical protein